MMVVLRSGIAISTLLALSAASAQQPAANGSAEPTVRVDSTSRWITTWAASPQAYVPPPANVTVAPEYRLPVSIKDQTVRQIVHVSAGGDPIRIRLSNEFGTRRVTIGAAAVAISDGEDRIKPGSSRAITFAGRSSVVIPPGAPILSDPVALEVASLSDVAISLYLPEDTQPKTIHAEGLQTAYLSTRGNVVAAAAVPGATTFTQRLFLTSMEVRTDTVKGTIVALGDSITDGERTRPNTDQRWPDLLAKRLAAASANSMPFGMANEGISGNALLHSAVYGGAADSNPSALARFDRDVGGLSGVSHLIVMDGVNDLDSIGMKVDGRRIDVPSLAASADDMIGGYQQIIARAHAHGIKVFGATIMPYEGEGIETDGRVTQENAWSPAKETMRTAINHWILDSHAFDGVIDFDAVVRDPTHPSRLRSEFDSGDHIHPSDAGIAAMANSIDLLLF